jgi:hypothetical protein
MFFRLRKEYLKYAEHLQQSGSGIHSGNEDSVSGHSAPGLSEEQLKFYIGPDGPDENISIMGKNLWGMCESVFTSFTF